MENNAREGMFRLWLKTKPFVFMIAIQCGLATMTVIAKFALGEGMSTFTFIAYRHMLATLILAPFAVALERNALSQITLSIFFKAVALGLLESIFDQNVYYMGLRLSSSATFAATMANIIPSITFALAWILRLERVRLREKGSIAKIVGTIVSLSGATVMTLYRGPTIVKALPSKISTKHSYAHNGSKDKIKGSIFIIISCFAWSCFVILQTITLKEYPYEISLPALICFAGAVESTALAAVMERGDMTAWALGWNYKLLAIVFSAIVCSGMTYYLQGSVMRDKGPVFATAFSPMNMILVAVPGLLLLGENVFLGGAIGSLLIVLGFYFVVWGKSRDPVRNNQVTSTELVTRDVSDQLETQVTSATDYKT